MRWKMDGWMVVPARAGVSECVSRPSSWDAPGRTAQCTWQIESGHQDAQQMHLAFEPAQSDTTNPDMGSGKFQEASSRVHRAIGLVPTHSVHCCQTDTTPHMSLKRPNVMKSLQPALLTKPRAGGRQSIELSTMRLVKTLSVTT